MTDLPDRGFWGDLWRGARLPFRAFALLFRTPALRARAALCAVVTAAALLGSLVAALAAARALAHGLVGEGGWRSVLAVGLEVVLFLALFAAGALTVPNLVLSPLQDPLSEATEVAVGRPPSGVAGGWRATAVSLAHTTLRLALMLGGWVVLLPLHLLPGVGSGAWFVASGLWSAFWLAAEHLGTPMARRAKPFGQVVGSLRRRPGLAFGLGGSLWVLLWLPVVDFFLMPVAVVAGTLLFDGLYPSTGEGNAAGAEGVGLP